MATVVLIGFMGSGKSAVGRALAHRAGARFVDTDKEIERIEGMSVPRVFANHGETIFRALETSVLQELLDQAEQSPEHRRYLTLVVSTGGGIPLQSENQSLLTRLGHIVWLRARPETIAGRVAHKLPSRPLLAGHADDLVARINKLIEVREPAYAELANYILDTDDCPNPEYTSGLVLDHWRNVVARPAKHHEIG